MLTVCATCYSNVLLHNCTSLYALLIPYYTVYTLVVNHCYQGITRLTESVLCAIVWYYLGNVDPILMHSRCVWQVIDNIDEFWPCRGPTISQKNKKIFLARGITVAKIQHNIIRC